MVALGGAYFHRSKSGRYRRCLDRSRRCRGGGMISREHHDIAHSGTPTFADAWGVYSHIWPIKKRGGPVSACCNGTSYCLYAKFLFVMSTTARNGERLGAMHLGTLGQIRSGQISAVDECETGPSAAGFLLRTGKGLCSCGHHRLWRSRGPSKATEVKFGFPKDPSVRFFPTSHQCFTRRRAQPRRSRPRSAVRFATSSFAYQADKNGPAMLLLCSSRKSAAAITCGT